MTEILAKEANKRDRVSQSDFPSIALEPARKIADAIWDNFAGKGAPPHQIALAMDLSPTSGYWRNLCGASLAFGLTEGGYAANQITLTPLGRRLVAPLLEDDDLEAAKEASLQPRIVREFFNRYDKAKLPKDEIGENVLVSMGLPKERAKKSFELMKEIGSAAGFVINTKTGPFVALDLAVGSQNVPSRNDPIDHEEAEFEEPTVSRSSTTPLPLDEIPAIVASRPPRVFISHGSNQKILDQVKEIVQFGKFEAIISKERESVSKPVPEKVLDDMRSCTAAVIHVAVESSMTDELGNNVRNINGNVLIEIGAAMALYKRNFVLLVEEGLVLPSNLQGLYECRFTGDELSASATMKLLKAFNDFKFSE